MSTAERGAGARTSPARTEYRDLRAENRLRAERIRAHRLAAAEARAERQRHLIESLSLDWVTPYAELLDLQTRTGDPLVAGPSSYWQRQRGANWPIYRTEQELNLLRAPARILLATNGNAQGLVEGLTSYTVGSGCTYRMGKVNDRDDTPQELIDASQRVVDRILERADWKGGCQPGIEPECFGRSIEDGEFLLCHYYREDGYTDFRIQEPEQLTQPPGSDWNEYSFGIQTPRNDAAKHERYYLQYGDTPSEGEEYDPDEVTHFRRNVRRNMKRGISDFTFDTYDALYLASRLRTNLGDTAAQQAAIVAVRQWETGTQDELQAFNDADADFTQGDPLTGRQQNVKRKNRGQYEDVPKGMAYIAGPIASSTPIHIQVLDACLRGAGQKWQAPAWLMSGDVNAMNYATSLTAESPFVKTVQRMQGDYCAAFRRAVWLALRHYVRTHGLRDKTGRVWAWEEVEDLLKLSVTAPSPETRNKLEEAQRAATEIPLGVQSRQAYMQEQGRDPDRIEADNQEYADKNGPPANPLPDRPPPDGGGTGGGAGARTSPGDPFGLESDAGQDAVGRALLESGFTGALKDSAGRERHYVDGKQVAAPPDAKPADKPADKPAGSPGTVSPGEGPWRTHAVRQHLADAIRNSGLPPEQQQRYGQAAKVALSRMPARALDRISQNLKATTFHPDLKAVGKAALADAESIPGLSDAGRAKIAALRPDVESGKSMVGGAYVKRPDGPTMHLDGHFAATGMPGAHGGRVQTAAEVYAHELAHAIDGPDNVASNSAPWAEAFEAEIGPKADGADGPKLTKYAQKDRAEGWAEFGRLVYGGAVPLDRVEKEFPRCAAVWKAAKIWPS